MSLRAMQWTAIGHEELAMVLSGLNARIDAIGPPALSMRL
jgi:hypothetical protein